jgi:hypothetical protein
MFIRLTTRKALNAVKIYETIYHTKSEDKSVIIINNPTDLKDTGKVKSKKQEVRNKRLLTLLTILNPNQIKPKRIKNLFIRWRLC